MKVTHDSYGVSNTPAGVEVLRPPLGASPPRAASAWTCYLCKSAGPGGSAGYQRHYLTHHADDLNAEWVNR